MVKVKKLNAVMVGLYLMLGEIFNRSTVTWEDGNMMRETSGWSYAYM